MKKVFGSFLILFLSISVLHSQSAELLDFVNDTTFIKVPEDSNSVPGKNPFVLDQRGKPANLLGITQRTKWLVIPVDHYLMFEKPLAQLMKNHLKDSFTLTEKYMLVIDNLTYWKNGTPLFNSGMYLNAGTRLVNEKGETIRDWQWELKDPEKEEGEAQRIGSLIYLWMEKQNEALSDYSMTFPVSPFRYRRQLVSWLDAIYLADGFIINGHLSLDFPADQMQSYTRGSAGIYYRKSSRHQSIAIGGFDQQWYARLNDHFVGRSNVTGRIGFNNFNEGKFTQVKWWNIFMINIGLTQTIEYRARYLKGLFTGIGVYLNINTLPRIIDTFEPGLIFTCGIYLP